jgi:hypothetical protein
MILPIIMFKLKDFKSDKAKKQKLTELKKMIDELSKQIQ